VPTNLIARDRVAELLALSPSAHVAVIGDAMLDVYLRGDVDRVSPEAPVPIVRVRERRHALGGAANVAQNVTALGARCTLAAAIGEDAQGRSIRDLLRGIGASDDALITVERPTTTKTRVVARAQQLLRFDEEDDQDVLGADGERILKAALRAADRANAVVFEDYNKGMLTPGLIRAVMERARARHIPVVVDPKYRHFFAYRGATVFKPNRRELEAALGAAIDLEHPEGMHSAFEKLGCEHLLLTLGERGMTLLSADGTSLVVPTTAREVYDVVGAGDTVTAYLAVMLAVGANAREAAIIANFAAGVEVGKLGAQTVSAAEVLDAFDNYEIPGIE
jgi:D-beta-D-heptose 7-phosphate kinase/D-beta-D-heptose 1-phosphate adenosyltransferase